MHPALLDSFRHEWPSDRPSMRSVFTASGANWVWPGSRRSGPNQYVEFRHEFALDGATGGDLHISVDSDYAAWVNGEFVGSGQFSDYPDLKTWDTLDVGRSLRPGRNVLCVLAWYKGETSSCYLKGDPGLIYLLRAGSHSIVSGQNAIWRISRCYRNGPIDRISMQLGLTFEYDARPDDGWTTPDYRPGSEWAAAREADIAPAESRQTAQRPLSKLVVGERLTTRIAAQGLFKRESEDGSVAARMQADFLSARRLREVTEGEPRGTLPAVDGIAFTRADGVYLVIDLGREAAGLMELDIEASEGQILDIAWGEHLDDLRVRAEVGGRNFACRYTCRAGRQTFTHPFTRIAGRYIELHVSAPGFRLFYAGLRPTDYPVETRGSFASPDTMLAAIHETSVRTLRLCMHEHYEDCPWREQALYANDSRNQALCGYYCFGEYRFPAVSFDLLGRGLKEDGFLELCAPAGVPITIPSFSLVWILELADHLLFSGDTGFVSRQYPTVRRMIATYSEALREGLLPCPVGKRYWQFYDWAPTLDGIDAKDWTWSAGVDGLRFDAPLNMLFCMALEAAARLADALGFARDAVGYRATAVKVRASAHRLFWDAGKGLYRTYANTRAYGFAELTQAFAILSGVAPESSASGLRARLAQSDNGMVETTLSQAIYKFEALLGEPEKYGRRVFDKIATDWGGMLTRGATSFWETMKGGADFDCAGSLCHGWSATPVYFAGAYLLGIKPLDPGFRTIAFKPVRGVVDRASGVVPTPHGPITVRWTDTEGGVDARIDCPEQVKVVGMQNMGA